MKKQVAIFYHYNHGKKEIWIVKEINNLYTEHDADVDMVNLNLKYADTDHSFTVVIERVF